MNAIATLQDPFAHNAFVSPESGEVGRSIWRLLNIGWEMGIPTSMTETEARQRPDTLAQRFQILAKIWRDECAHLSSVREMVMHPAYQQIVGMGPSVLSFILKELERQTDHWFWALQAITQENPVLAEHRGNVAEMTRDWLEWARARGIRW